MLTVTIFGVGLIGGSLALCFKDKPNIHVIGHDPHPHNVAKMLELNIVDEATTNMREAAERAQIIFICVPVSVLESYLTELRHMHLQPGCIITDVGSTKDAISKCAEQLQFDRAFFIGGHPMAGSERSGMEAASSYLFENAFYVLTPLQDTPDNIVLRLADVLQWTKAQIVCTNTWEHDEIVGAISHLPHLIAVCLVNQVRKYNEQNMLYKSLAAGGFRDITRIASSNPTLWRDILLSNKDVLLRLLDDWDNMISNFRKMLVEEDGEQIVKQFELAGNFRNQVPDRKLGMLRTMYDVYVNIPDQPGIIGKITTLLGNHHISLSNLEITESRLDVPGVLRLSFTKQNAANDAKQLLQTNQFDVHVD